jgi:formate hydrogenlyase subunit 3/multisubunit Na+/H+ antiporter MnhD subunit
LLTLFVFFELMTFSSYLLVIHEQDREAMSAGNVYLYMSVIGGLILLAAVFVLQYAAGHTRFEPMLAALVTKGISPWLVLALVIGGFGVKAGLIPLHIWLPRAHPVAPAPASALLSALMIKTGAYGFFRFLFTILSAPDGDALFVFQQNFGYLFIWIGAGTMFAGAVMGIMSTSMKKVLAYSSISQMGYILFALGTGAFLGSHGAAALAGAWLHAINHAFFKSFLFLLAGAVFLHTGELDLDKLGGLRKQMPWAFGFFLVAAASITGVPGFNGYVSKVLIHEAILEAYHLHGWPMLLWLERIFVFTGGLTAAYITKLWLKTFVAKPKQSWDGVQDLSLRHKGVFAVYTAVVLFIGTQAQRVVNALALPVVGEIRFNPGDVDHLTHVPYWSGHEMQSALVSYAIAAAVLILVWKFGDRVKVPKWLSVEYLFYKPVFRAAQGFVERRGAEGEGTKEAAGASLSIDGAGAAAVVLAVVLVIFLWYGIV